jgi:hypothetical protein
VSVTREIARFSFPRAKARAFLFENAPLLLLSWDRDNVRLLFLIKEQRGDELVLDYPGEMFADRVLSVIEGIFHIQLQEGNGPARLYTLGSYFEAGRRFYGAYYAEGMEQPDVVLFRVEGEAPQCSLEPLDEEEYERAAAAFVEQHRDFMEIRQANRT